MQARKFKRCSYSVLDSSFPGLQFHEAGQALPVKHFLRQVKPQWKQEEGDERLIAQMVERVKSRSRSDEYDSILGLSGGLDSSYMLHIAVKELGLNPLVFHVDAGWNSEGAVQNISRMVDALGLDLYTEVIDWAEMRDFQLAWFRAGVPHLDIPQDHAFVATLYRYAEKFGIRTILNGGNLSNEGIRNPLKYFYYGTDMRHIRDVLRATGPVELPTYPFSSVLRHKAYLRYVKGIEVVRPLNLIHFRKAEAERTLSSLYRWSPFAQKHFESRFTRYFEGYWLPTRYGFDPRTVQLSSLIVTDQISREEAIETLSRPSLSREEVAREQRFVASKLEISEEQLENLMHLPKRYYFDFKNSVNFFGMGARALQLIGQEKSLKK